MIIMLSGCSMLKIPFIGNSTPKYKLQKNYEWEYFKDKNAGVVYKKIVKNTDKIVPEKTFIQKIGAWIGGLTLLGIIAVSLGWISPAVIALFLWKVGLRWKRGFVETAIGIKQAQAVNENEKLHNELKAVQSKQTKKLVGQVKAGL